MIRHVIKCCDDVFDFVQREVHVKLVREWYTASMCMLPLKYPAMMMDRPKAIHAKSDSTSGTVGLLTCVLVAFVLVFVSIDVLLGVFWACEPASFGFCKVMKEDRERLNMWEELDLP